MCSKCQKYGRQLKYGFPCVHQQSSRYTEGEGKASVKLAEPEIIVHWLIILLVVGRSLLQISTEIFRGFTQSTKTMVG